MFSLVLFGIAAGALCAQPSLRTEGGKMQFAAGAGKDFEFINDGKVTATVSGIQGAASKLRADLDSVEGAAATLGLAVDGATQEATKLRREVTCNKQDACDVATALGKSSAEISASLTEKVAKIMAESLGKAGASGSASAARKIVAISSDCPSAGCQAGRHTITAVVEAASLPGAPSLLKNLPIYRCVFTSKAIKLEYSASSADGFSVPCQIPVADTTKVDTGKGFTVRLELYMGQHIKIPYIEAKALTETDVKVVSVGPTIAAVSDVSLKIHQLKKAGQDYVYEVTVAISDPDTPASKLSVAAASSDSKVAAAIKAVAGAKDTYKLTLTLKKLSTLKTKIAVTAKDNLGKTAKMEFQVSLTTRKPPVLLIPFEKESPVDTSPNKFRVVRSGGHCTAGTAPPIEGVSRSCRFRGLDHRTYFYINEFSKFSFGTNTFTIDMWVKFNRLDFRTGNYGLFGQTNSHGRYGWNMLDVTNAGSPRISWYCSRCSNNPGGTVGGQGGHLKTNTWYHVALIRGWGGDKDMWAITINGIERGKAKKPFAFPLKQSQIVLGAWGFDGIRDYLAGDMSHMRVTLGQALWTKPFNPPKTRGDYEY